MITAFADGSAWRDEGGAGIVLLIGGDIIREGLYLGSPCTNQSAELLAALRALNTITKALGANQDIRLISDSAYLINGMTEEWWRRWEANGWRTTSKKSVAHRLEWETLRDYAGVHEIEWEHVRGHGRGGVTGGLRRYNEIADNLAHVARTERRSWFNRVTRR